MDNTEKYLSYEGLTTYNDELIRRLTDLDYDPDRMFADKTELFSLEKWGVNRFGRVVGLKAGLMITLDGQIWQLEDPVVFNSILTGNQSIASKVLIPMEDLGWKIVGNTVDFNINGHILELTK